MGYNAYAYIVVGVCLEGEKTITRKTVKAFPHNHPETMKFCPETGKKLWEEEVTFLDGSELCDYKFAGLDVKVSGCEERLEKGSLAFIGEAIEYERDKAVFVTQEEIAKIKAKVMAKLSPFSLWDENEFGVYPLLYESY